MKIDSSVLNFFCQAESAETEYQLYKLFEDKVLGKIANAQFSVFSLSCAKNRSENTFRLNYGRKIFDKKIIKEIIELQAITELGEGEFKLCEYLQENYLLVCLGIEKKQKFYGIIKVKDEVDNKLYGHIFNFLAAANKRIHLQRKAKHFQELAYLDDATQLANQRKLSLDLDQLIANSDEEKAELSVLFIDIDYFKQVNDKWGHLIGTNILCEFGQILKKILRDSDYVYRYGGDEFVAFLPRTNGKQAMLVANRILSQVKEHEFNFKVTRSDEITTHKLSLSIGVATYPEHAGHKEEILSLADRMMYEAKKAGRGQARFASDFLIKKAEA